MSKTQVETLVAKYVRQFERILREELPTSNGREILVSLQTDECYFQDLLSIRVARPRSERRAA